MQTDVSIFSTGTELTNGKSIDTNSNWLSSQLYGLGFITKKILILPDNPKLISNEIESIVKSSKKSLILFTGGLGPTQDDFTLELICKMTNQKKIQFDPSYKKLLSIYELKKMDMSTLKIASRQTYYPEKAVVFENSVGIAPAFSLRLENDNYIICMPGVPAEMKAVFSNHIQTYILSLFNSKKLFTDSRLIWQISESSLQEGFLRKNQTLKNKEIQWGISVKRGYVKVHFYSQSKNLLDQVVQELEDFYQEKITDNLFDVLPRLFVSNKQTLGVAESCTGGLLGKKITDKSDSSQYFFGSIVSYHNFVKNSLLKVSNEVLQKEGAVSELVAQKMLFGVIEVLGVDFGVSITGIAGPNGDTQNKKTGLAFIGVGNKNKYKIYKVFFPSERTYFRDYLTNLAFYFLYLQIK